MKPTDEELRTAAVRLHFDEGNVEIDPGAEVSRGNANDDAAEIEAGNSPGAYVRAWVWVPYDAVTDEDRANASEHEQEVAVSKQRLTALLDNLPTDDRCEACKVEHHDTCPLVAGCPCCANAKAG